MQNVRFSLMGVVLLLLQVNNVISMEISEGKKSNNALVRVLSLKQLCNNTIAESIQKNDINFLTSPAKMEIFSDLPEELDKKITKNLFCYKSGYKYLYEKNTSKIDYELMFDETHNCVTFTNNNNATVTLFTMNDEKIISSPLSDYHNGSLGMERDYEEKGFLRVQKGNGRCYSGIRKSINNQQKLVSWEDKKRDIYKNVDSIQFDKSKKTCMVKNGSTVIIENYKNGNESKIVLQGIKNAFLNPNGKQLLLKRIDQPAELITIKDQKTVFSFKEFDQKTIILRHWFIQFSDDGNYLRVFQLKDEGDVYHILDTNSGKICMSTPDCPSLFCKYNNKKYFVLERSRKKCLMPIENLCKLNDYSKKSSYTVEDIITSGIGKEFNDFESFHPNGKHMMLKSEGQLKLVDLKSEKPVFIVNNTIHHYAFSNPTGKMLYIDHPEGFEIIALRNDFTVTEYLLNRFMIEKNITESDLSNYPHMQKIYNKMDEDKRLFCCCDNGEKNANFWLQNINTFISSSCVIS